MLRTSKPFIVRLLLIGAASLIPLFLSQLILTGPPRQLAFEAERAAAEIDRLLDLRMRQVFTLAAFPSVRAFAGAGPADRAQRATVALNELRAWVAADTQVREVLVTNKDGVVIMSTGEGWNSELNSREFIREALAGQLAVSPVRRESGEFSVYFAAPVLDSQRELAGALAARIAAQELWSAVPKGEGWYAMLVDENGVRLEDTGDPARRLTALGPLDTPRAARIAREQTYGEQASMVQAGTLGTAQQLVTQGALDRLTGAEFDAGAVASQRLFTKPWSVLVVAPHPDLITELASLALPVLVALGLSVAAALALGRV